MTDSTGGAGQGATDAEIAAAIKQAEDARRQGRLPEAEQRYRGVLATQPDNVAALSGLASLLNQRGRLDEAFACLKRVTELAPKWPRGHNLLGALLQRMNRTAEAAECFRQSVVADPAYADGHHNYAAMLLLLNRVEDAASSARHALVLRPDFALAHHTLGMILERQTRLEEARDHYQRAVEIAPDNLETLFALGRLLRRLGKPEEALTLLQRAAEVRPSHPLIHAAIADTLADCHRYEDAVAAYSRELERAPDLVPVHGSMANAFEKLGRHDEALAAAQRAVQFGPKSADAHNALGIALSKLDRLDDSVAAFTRASELNPNHMHALLNLGKVLQRQGRLEAALLTLRGVAERFPDFKDGHRTLGVVLMQLNRLSAAVASLRRAIEIDPADPDSRLDLSMALLRMGQWQEGWNEYERRWGTKQMGARTFERMWTGQPLQDRTVIVHSEQGLGDTIQFVRYLELLADTGANVVLVAPKRLHRLLQPFARFARIESEGTFTANFQVPLISLPRQFGTEPVSVPQKVPYLFAEADAVERWRPRVGAHGFKIGICWQGNPKGTVDEGRSPPLAQFIPLARIPGVRLISLQKEFGLDQLATLPADVSVETLGEDFDSGPDAFIDTAAVMESLDLVIASDTSVAHVAGALGRPVWMVLKYAPDWRWLLERQDTPWYPTMRLYRQRQPGQWEHAFEAIAQDLRRLVADSPSPRPLLPEADRAQPMVAVSWGELFDKITILEIKEQRLASPTALANVRRELSILRQASERPPVDQPEIAALKAALRTVNERLWVIEDDIRAKEAQQSFDAEFVRLARAVYRTNDERSRIKRDINLLLGSTLREEKQYSEY